MLKKSSYSSTELIIIKGYLYRGGHIDHSPLHKQGTGAESSNCVRESAQALYQHL